MRRRKTKTLSAAFEELKADYRAGKDTRFTSRLSGVSSAGSGADYHYRNETQYLHMMERARHYQRNDPVIGQAVRRLVANVVQEGFRYDPQTGDAAVDNLLKSRWQSWSEDPDKCHSEGELCFHQIERLVFSSVVVDGDVLALPLRTGEVQMVESHRLRTPRNTKRNVVHGILLDERARRQEYWITRENLDPMRTLSRVSDIKQYAARDENGNRLVIHVYDPQRFSQRRGVTALAPISDMVGMHDDLEFTSLVKQQMSALIAIFHERGPNWEPGGDQQKGGRYDSEDGRGFTRTIEGVSAGLEVFGDIDEKLSAFSPNIPGSQFFPHVMLVLTFIAVNLDLPVAVLLLDPSNTNFSGWRGAIDQARMRFKQMQQWFVESFHRPIFLWKLRQWIASDPEIARAAQREDINLANHRWHCSGFPYIEPLKDASADLMQLRNALNSPRRIQAARNRDWDDISSEIVEDNRLAIVKAIRAADEINKEFSSANVHWRELISLPTPDGVQIGLSTANSEEPQQPQQPEHNRLIGSLNGSHYNN